MKKVYLETDKDQNIIGWGTSPFNGDMNAIEVEEDHEFLQMPSYYYLNDEQKLVKNTNRQLEVMKLSKNEEMNLICQQEILSGFSHKIDGTDYFFSFDMEAQMNFQSWERVLNLGLVQSVNCTVREEGVYKRIALDVYEINELTVKTIEHKEEKLSRYRDHLLPLIAAASSLEELEMVHWDINLPI